MAACRLFDEDEVCLITPDKGYVYGLVLENAEFISSDEEGDDLPGQITKGSVRVAWHPDGKETVVEENKVNSKSKTALLNRKSIGNNTLRLKDAVTISARAPLMLNFSVRVRVRFKIKIRLTVYCFSVMVCVRFRIRVRVMVT